MVVRARRGDLTALELLITEYQQPIGRYVIAETGAREDYLDICQTVFVNMMKGLPRLRSEDVFEPWLFQIARNACMDYLRRERHRRRLFVPMTEQHDLPAPHPEPLGNSGAEGLRDAISQLGADQRKVITLSMEQPRSYQELAQMTGSSIPSVRNRLARARQRLRQLLGRREDPHGE